MVYLERLRQKKEQRTDELDSKVRMYELIIFVLKLFNDLYQVDINNPEEMRNCFLEHIQNGDACLSRGKYLSALNYMFSFFSSSNSIGDLDNGIEHLAKAVSFCNHPQDLLALFQQTLPRELFEAIVMRVPRMAQV